MHTMGKRCAKHKKMRSRKDAVTWAQVKSRKVIHFKRTVELNYRIWNKIPVTKSSTFSIWHSHKDWDQKGMTKQCERSRTSDTYAFLGLVSFLVQVVKWLDCEHILWPRSNLLKFGRVNVFSYTQDENGCSLLLETFGRYIKRRVHSLVCCLFSSRNYQNRRERNKAMLRLFHKYNTYWYSIVYGAPIGFF